MKVPNPMGKDPDGEVPEGYTRFTEMPGYKPPTGFNPTANYLPGTAPAADDQTSQLQEWYDRQQTSAQALASATSMLVNHQNWTKGLGIARLGQPLEADAGRSKTDRMLNGSNMRREDTLPTGPGFAYGTHLFKHHGMLKKMEQRKKKDGKLAVYTDQMEALKGALKSMGVRSEKNPGGMPIDIAEAKKIWFGDEKIDPLEEAQWRTTIELGDSKIDPKKIRRFTNYDGSLTWEILNDDKTVSSRFTMGDYAGTKIFAQGGYSKFAELLKQAQEKIGPDREADFEALRGMF